jgi:hypothetical protein
VALLTIRQKQKVFMGIVLMLTVPIWGPFWLLIWALRQAGRQKQINQTEAHRKDLAHAKRWAFIEDRHQERMAALKASKQPPSTTSEPPL